MLYSPTLFRVLTVVGILLFGVGLTVTLVTDQAVVGQELRLIGALYYLGSSCLYLLAQAVIYLQWLNNKKP